MHSEAKSHRLMQTAEVGPEVALALRHKSRSRGCLEDDPQHVPGKRGCWQHVVEPLNSRTSDFGELVRL